MIELQEIMLRPFRPDHQSEVKQLILSGLAEHWGQLDPTKNLDLDDISSTYANATFLTAWLGGRLVGTGALVPREERAAEIVRMSVASEMRRCGIGRMILQALCQKARELGFQRVILETTEMWIEVVSFYLNDGFQITHRKDGDVYFAFNLATD